MGGCWALTPDRNLPMCTRCREYGYCCDAEGESNMVCQKNHWKVGGTGPSVLRWQQRLRLWRSGRGRRAMALAWWRPRKRRPVLGHRVLRGEVAMAAGGRRRGARRARRGAVDPREGRDGGGVWCESQGFASRQPATSDRAKGQSPTYTVALNPDLPGPHTLSVADGRRILNQLTPNHSLTTLPRCMPRRAAGYGYIIL